MTLQIRRMADRVSRSVSPKPGDYAKLNIVLKKVSSKIRAEARRRHLSVRVEVEGSVAKDTWIRTDKDIDIFIIFPEGTGREEATGLGLQLAKKASGNNWKLGYAEHPYLETEVGGYTLDIVPSVAMREGERPVTSVDRTPLHTRFVMQEADSKLRADVRVLKQFMKGLGVYGAELRTGGFSGYLCELLIIHYGGFEQVVKAMAKWGERTVIDHRDLHGGRAGEAFNGSLVVVDPVDIRRNVAAAVSPRAYMELVAASTCFVKKPELNFFFPKTPSRDFQEIWKRLELRGTPVVGVVTGCPPLASDILWGELQKSLLRIVALLKQNGFRPLEWTVWSDEKKLTIFLVQLMEGNISPTRIHEGPKVTMREEADRFMEKYMDKKKVLAGPYIKDGHWCVELARGDVSAKGLLQGGLTKLRLSRHVEEQLRKGFKVHVDRELEGLLEGRGELLRSFLLKFVEKRPPWMS